MGLMEGAGASPLDAGKRNGYLSDVGGSPIDFPGSRSSRYILVIQRREEVTDLPTCMYGYASGNVLHTIMLIRFILASSRSSAMK